MAAHLIWKILKTIDSFYRLCSKNIKTARAGSCSLDGTFSTLDQALVISLCSCFIDETRNHIYKLIEGWSGFRRALRRALDDWRFFLPPCWLRYVGECLSWEISFEIRCNKELICNWMIFSNEHCSPLHRTCNFQTRLDQAVFKLKGIVVLVHQLPNLKQILFKKISIFHLPYA